MDPSEFRVLGGLLRGAVASLAAPTDHIVEIADEDWGHLTTEVENELLAVLSIVATGTMEHQIVDLGDGATTVMDTAAADNPEALQRMRDWSGRQRREREHTAAVLHGMEEASQD